LGGIRLRPINGTSFKWFIGAGGVCGIVALLYNKNDYESKGIGTLDEANLIVGKGFSGYYYETGFEFIGQKFGVRIRASSEILATGRIETLNNRLSYTLYSVGLQYIQKI